MTYLCASSALEHFNKYGYLVVPALITNKDGALQDAKKKCMHVVQQAAVEASCPPPNTGRRGDDDDDDDDDDEEEDEDLSWIVTGHGCIFEVPTSNEARTARRRDEYVRAAKGTCLNNVVERVAHTVAACLGAETFENNVRLFNDQYIVKPPQSTSAFGWHTDDQGVRKENAHTAPYVSVWIALDDADEQSGCLWVRNAKRKRDEEGEGEHDKGKPLVVNAGDAVILRHDVEHRSSANRARRWRCAYMPQFSLGTVAFRDGSPVALDVELRDATL